jgi:hypothetical protein
MESKISAKSTAEKVVGASASNGEGPENSTGSASRPNRFDSRVSLKQKREE